MLPEIMRILKMKSRICNVSMLLNDNTGDCEKIKYIYIIFFRILQVILLKGVCDQLG